MKLVCTHNVYEKESVIAAMERNDCVVRAIASSFDIPYDDAHKYVANLFNRHKGKGTPGTVMRMRGLSEAFGKKVVELGEIIPEFSPTNKSLKRWYKKRGVMSWGAYTTERFIEKYPTGTYFILVSGHAFTIKDGVIYGNQGYDARPKARIEQAFKIG